MRFSLRTLLSGLTLSLLLPGAFGTRRLHAMPPPLPGEVKAYEQDGTLERRKAFARSMGDHRMDPALLADANRRLRKLASDAGVLVPQAKDLAMTPPPGWAGMPTKGNVKVLILCIDFSDYPHDDNNNSVTQVTNRIFGNGSSGGPAPYESLTNFYSRSSYGQLTLSGTVLGWYRAGYTRASMAQTTAGRQKLIKEALQSFDTSHDFSQYDNNGDGVIDYFAVIWSGPDNGWSNFWWGYQTSWSNSTTSLTLDGKRLGKYSWQWESKNGYTWSYPSFDPRVLIHETGHALGLPDYYDYDDTLGPLGGVGGLDQMDANKGDHNCFSKFLLDWITPQVVTTATANLQLRSSGDNGDALIVMNQNPNGCFGEYFMVQNRYRVANDLSAGYPTNGLLIWHVDSRLDSSGNDFLYDNSYTEHKLLRLMEADGLEQIEKGGSANAGDYYVSGKVFGPASMPSSARYDGAVTAMGVDTISAAGTTMTLNVTKVTDSTAPTGKPGKPSCTTDADTLTATWTLGTAADPDSGIAGYHLQLGSSPGTSDVFNGGRGNVFDATLTDLGAWDGLPLYARVAALNGAGGESAWSDSSDSTAISLPSFSASVLDNNTCTFKVLGSWSTDSTTNHAGGSSAKSATITDSQRTYLQTRVTGPGTLTFAWKTSSESGYDFLTFTVDGSVPSTIQPISGEVAWTTRTYQVPTGSHLLRWTYAKDQSDSAGSDAGWVDNVQWSGATTANVTAQVSPATYIAVPGATISYTAAVSNQVSDNRVNWTISGSGGTFNPLQTASGAATVLTAGASTGLFTITATPVESPNTPGTATLSLVDPSTVTVTNTPSATSVNYGGTVTFSGAAQGITNTAVTYSVVSGGGSVDSSTGVYTAPASGTSATIRATSVGAPTRYQDATVTLVDISALNLVVSPAICTLLPGGQQTFTVSGDLGGGVNWTVNNSASIILGLLTVPASTPMADRTYTVTATSKLDGSKTGTATVTVKSMDLNGDTALDLRDILFLAKEWGNGSTSKANLKGSGTVDQSDLDALMTRVMAAQ